jgi:hypothetical protein
MGNIMASLAKRLRPHLHFMILVPIFMTLMTPMTVVSVLSPDRLLPHNGDSNLYLWNSWYVDQVLAGTQDFWYSTNLFYPEGLDLSYHSISIPHMFLLSVFKIILPATHAYNLAILVLMYMTIWAGYIYILHLTKHHWVSLFGACVFGLSLQVVFRTHHPDLSFLATIPLSLYFIERSIKEQNRRLAIGAGLLTGFTALIGMYIFVCLLITLGIRMAMLLVADWNWRSPKIWQLIIIFGMMIFLTASLRIYPMVTNRAGLDEALQKGTGDPTTVIEDDSDILLYVVNTGNQFWGRLQSDFWGYSYDLERPQYLSYICILVIIIGLLYKQSRPRILGWLIIFLPFFILRLGSFLTINGIPNYDIILPKFYLNQLIPPIFKAFHNAGFFQVGIVLPFALMSTYGLLALIKGQPNRYPIKQMGFIILVSVFVLIETNILVGIRTITDAQIIFFERLANGEHEQGALINLPMGREPSKSYMLHQTIHHQPQVEGMASRTPAKAYQYIDANPALHAWRQSEIFRCDTVQAETYLQAINALIQDNFVYVIFHKQLSSADDMADNFVDNLPYYGDDFIAVYKLTDLYSACEAS